MTEERVVRCGLAPTPFSGDTRASLLAADRDVVLSYRLAPHQAAFDLSLGGYLESSAEWAVIRFWNCITATFGQPNDEALPGHRLYSKGLDYYGVFEVIDSCLIEELVAVNRVRFPETSAGSLRHFVFTFHESTFECVAGGFTVELCDDPFDVVAKILRESIRT